MMMAQAELPTTKVAPTSLDQPQPELDSFHVSSFSDSDSSVDETEVEADAPLLPEANASCLAEQLWEPFRSLVMNPLTTLVVCLCVNAAFILTWYASSMHPLLVLTHQAPRTFLAWLAHLITRPGLFVLVVALVVCIARLAALVLSYPGHLQVVARDCERSFALMIKKWVRLTADTTDELIQLLLSPEPCTPETTTAFREVYTSFESCLTNIMVVLQRSLEIVDEEETLTTDGKRVLAHIRVYLEYAEKLRPSFAQLAADTTPNMEALRQQLDLDKPLVEFGMCVQDLRDVIECVGEPPGTPKRSGLWGLLCELVLARLRPLRIVASLSLMRADLIARHNGRQVWVPGYERNRIDGMFIPGLGLPIQNAERTVILCNPNCGLYEFHHFQSDWIQFYTKLGINVFLFNYRGYGRTKGYPSPHANNLDGMAVAAYLRNDKSIQRLAIHGESIGGMVATHVAKHADGIELLIADRTFANLPAVAQRLVASWAGRALSCVTRWQTDNVTNYLDATCHKVVCCDPCDEIIADGSSLKAGIALRLELGDLQAQTPKARPAAPRRLAACAPVGYDAVSEMSTEIVIGKPLTEAIVAKFARHLLRLADRAKDAMELEMTDATVIDVDDAGHGKDLIALWSAIASLDGHCGQTLFYAAGSGLEGIRAWTTSFIVWGPSTRLAAVPVARRPHDFVTPLPIEHVRVLLQRVRSAAAWLTTDDDASYVMDIIEYLYASMQARSAKATDDAMLGALVPLSCGHNANFSEQEKQALLAHLVAYKWADASSAEDESSK